MSKERKFALISLILLVPVPSIGTAMGMIIMPDTAIGQGFFIACKVWLLGLPIAWLIFIDRGRLSWSKPEKGGFGVAAVWGISISIIIFAAYYFIGVHLIDQSAMKEMAQTVGLDRLPVYLGGVVYWVTINSLLEEYVWRWFVLRKCEVLIGARGAIVASSLGFTLHHIVALQVYFPWYVTAIASLGIFVGGASWSWLYLRYSSIWPAYLSHAIVDVAVFAIGYKLIFC